MSIMKFAVSEIVPEYARTENLGDDRRVAVGVRQLVATCAACQVTWRANRSSEPVPGTFRSQTNVIRLTCGCGQEDLIPLRPLLRHATGAHTIQLD